MNYERRSIRKGFTLMEVLLVVAIIAILAGIVIVAINPARQIGQSNNAKRWAHINTVLNAVHQYAVDNNGLVPNTIPSGSNCEGEETYKICPTGAASCTNRVDLSVLTTDGLYLVSLPLNPGLSTVTEIGYNIIQDVNGRITVCAPGSYDDEVIEVIR